LWIQSGFASEDVQAVLYKRDGRALRVFLIQSKGDLLTIRLDKSNVNSTIEIARVERLKIKHFPYDETSVQQKFNQAEYAAVIATLEPVAAASAEYMGVQNNLQDVFNLLMKAYYRNGDMEKARGASTHLLKTQALELKTSAQVIRGLSALADDDLETAEAIQDQMKDSAAKLYLKASIARANKQVKEAMQTVVELIASHPNDLDWMPLAEFLCARLYLDMDRPKSAAEVARQMGSLYAGTCIEKEAQILRQTIERLTEQPE